MLYKILGQDTYPIHVMGNGVDRLDRTMTVSVVLVEGQGPDAAAYEGVGTPQWVAHAGRKLTLQEASRHFPGLEVALAKMGLRYRE